MKRLFFDIETAPCIGTFWRPGWKLRITPESIIQPVLIICISYSWNNEDQVHRLEWDRGDDRPMLEKFAQVLLEADEIVAHHGDGFDLPIVRTRCLLNGIDVSPFLRMFDTLKKVRGRFKFQSNKLDDIANELGLGRKIKTEYSMWKDLAVAVLWGTFNSAYDKNLNLMGVYCDEDVRVLRRVYNVLAPIVPHGTNAAVINDGAKWQCPSCESKNIYLNKTRTTATGIIKRELVCKDCRKFYTVSNKQYEGLVMYRINNGKAVRGTQ